MQKIFTAALPGATEGVRDGATHALDCKAFILKSRAKRGFDVGVVSATLLLLLPFILTIVGLLLVLQGRPVLFRHKRVGRNGVLFGCMKFRTMAVDSDAILRAHLASDAEARAEWQATHKLKDDPRVTPLGKIMRRLSVDELPQLFNILRGEMSLVGPRPIVLAEVPHYGARIELYHRVRPGLTGSWQIGGRSDVSYPRRVEMDADYVANWSFGRDLSILLKTVPAVLSAKGCY